MPEMYILMCADGTYYTGSTRDLERRLEEHHAGTYPDGYTASRRPVRLAYFERFDRIDDAWARERQIHGWSRAKKRALIDGRIDDVKRAASRAGHS
ncbi:MAG: GIY-YIG nuclease family protein [Microbacteriaceae bacterium]